MQDGWPRADSTQVTDLAAPSNALRLAAYDLSRFGVMASSSFKAVYSAKAAAPSPLSRLHSEQLIMTYAVPLDDARASSNPDCLVLKTAVCTQP